MKLKRLTWIAIVLLILAVGLVLLLGFSPEGLKSDQTGEISIDQAIARTGDLTISVSGSGELVAVSETQLSFGEKGELVALNVGVGDQVTAGDVLAILQLDRTEAEHMAVLAKAELDVQTARQRIDQLNQNAQLEAAEALLAYEQAQIVYESLQDYELEQALALQELRLVEEAVQAAIFVAGQFTHGADLVFIGDIGADVGGGTAVGFLDMSALVILDVADHDLCAFGNKKIHCSAANAAGAAGDDGNLSFKTSHGVFLLRLLWAQNSALGGKVHGEVVPCGEKRKLSAGDPGSC